MVAIGGTGGGVDKAVHSCIPGGHQHIQKAGNVVFIGVDRVFNRPRYRTQGCLMQDIIYTLAGLVAGCEVPDVAFDEAETSPFFW